MPYKYSDKINVSEQQYLQINDSTVSAVIALEGSDSTALSGKRFANYVYDVSSTIPNPAPTEVPCFVATGSLTRSSTVTAYAAGQIVNANAASTLPAIDVSTALGFSVANRKIAITTVYVISDNGANPAWTGFVDFFNVNNPATVTDYTAFAPTAATLVTNFANTADAISNTRKYSTTTNLSWQTEMLRKVTLDATGKTYVAPICSAAYTPKSGEVFTILIKFYLLN